MQTPPRQQGQEAPGAPIKLNNPFDFDFDEDDEFVQYQEFNHNGSPLPSLIKKSRRCHNAPGPRQARFIDPFDSDNENIQPNIVAKDQEFDANGSPKKRLIHIKKVCPNAPRK